MFMYDKSPVIITSLLCSFFDHKINVPRDDDEGQGPVDHETIVNGVKSPGVLHQAHNCAQTAHTSSDHIFPKCSTFHSFILS